MQNEIVLRHSKAWLLLHLFLGLLLTPLLIGIVIIVWTLLRYNTESLTLHPNSILIKRGVLSRNANEIPASKINNINTYKGLLGLILGFGNLGIYSANASEPELFKDIAHPEKVKNAIKMRMENAEGSVQTAISSNTKGPMRRFE